MKKTTNPIIVDESIIEIARECGYCIHYDENTKMIYFITVDEVDSHEENELSTQKLEKITLFRFLDDKYKVYYLLPNIELKNTYKAYHIITYPTKTMAKSVSPFTTGSILQASIKFDRVGRNRENCYSYDKYQSESESMQGLNDKIYEKWYNEVENIIDFKNQNINSDWSLKAKDFAIVLYCEPVTNPNYAVVFLSLESKTVKIDKSTFNSFAPKEGQIFVVAKEDNYNVTKSSLVFLESKVLFLNQFLYECDDLKLFFAKYQLCYKHPTLDANLIDLNSLKEEYYLIGFKKAIIYRDKDKLKKSLKCKNNKFNFVIDSIKNAENVGKYYVGKSLVRIRRNRNGDGFAYDVIKEFGKVLTEKQYKKIYEINNRNKNHQDRNDYSYENAVLEVEFFEKYFNMTDEELESLVKKDEQINTELDDDSSLVFVHETATDFTSDLEDYLIDEDEYEKDFYYGNEYEYLPDLREIYNEKNFEFELIQNEGLYYDDYDPQEDQECEYEEDLSKWFKEKFDDSFYECIDITDERFYLNFEKEKYCYKTLNSDAKMHLEHLYEISQSDKNIKQNNIGSNNAPPLPPKRKPRA